MERFSLIKIQGKKVKDPKTGRIVTEFYKDGEFFARFRPSHKRFTKRTKIVTINCWDWAIEWID